MGVRLKSLKDVVSQGTKLIKMDLDFLRANAKSIISPIIVSELDSSKKIQIIADSHVDFNKSIIKIIDK